MRVLVVGIGAVGGVIALRLKRAGHEVHGVARGDTGKILAEHGLTLSGAMGDATGRFPIHSAPPADVDFDLVVLATKTQDLGNAVREVARVVRTEVPVVTLQNGLRADTIAAEFVSPGRVIAGVVVFDAVSLEPGKIHVQRNGVILLGAPFAGGDPDLALTEGGPDVAQVAKILSDAVNTRVVKNVRACRWTKLVLNLNNALPAITGMSLQACYRDPGVARVGAAALREGVTVARASHERLGRLPWASPFLLALVTILPEFLAVAIIRMRMKRALGDADIWGSTYQSIARGRSTEVDYLNGEVVRAAARVDAPAPVNAALVAMVNEVAESGRFLAPDAVTSRVFRS